jgi:hypothetical protein
MNIQQVASPALSGQSNAFRGVLTDTDIEELRARNEERRQAAIKALGHRWVGVSMNGNGRSAAEALGIRGAA